MAKYWERHGNRDDDITNHHIKNRSRGGGDEAFNILRMKRGKHEVWHKIFGNKDIPEIIKLLERIQRMKERLEKGGY